MKSHHDSSSPLNALRKRSLAPLEMSKSGKTDSSTLNSDLLAKKCDASRPCPKNMFCDLNSGNVGFCEECASNKGCDAIGLISEEGVEECQEVVALGLLDVTAILIILLDLTCSVVDAQLL